MSLTAGPGSNDVKRGETLQVRITISKRREKIAAVIMIMGFTGIFISQAVLIGCNRHRCADSS